MLSPPRTETSEQESPLGRRRKKQMRPDQAKGSLRRVLPAAFWIATVLFAGCGVPGEPLPPLLEIPERATDLSATQVGSRLHLAWSPPRLTTEGTRVRRLARLELYGVFLPPGTALGDFPERARLLATLGTDAIAAGRERVLYELPLAVGQLRQTAFFAVKAINDKDKDAGFSNLVQVEIVDLPEAPLDLQATLTESAIHLAWKAPPLSAFGGTAPQPDGYQVYRAEAGSPQAARQTDSQPATQTVIMLGATSSAAYQDSTFEFGHSYVYSVRAFVGQGESTALTPPSHSAEVGAVDRFPPASPLNVRAVAVPGAVDLAWSPNSEADLAGYNVYRRDGDALLKLNMGLLPAPLFRDPSPTPGARYLYRVTALDGNGNESAASEDAVVTAE